MSARDQPRRRAVRKKPDLIISLQQAAKQDRRAQTDGDDGSTSHFGTR